MNRCRSRCIATADQTNHPKLTPPRTFARRPLRPSPNCDGDNSRVTRGRLGRRSPAPKGAAAAAPTVSMAASSLSSTGGDPSEDLPYRYRWPRPAVTVDCLIYTLDEGRPWILLIKRKNDPFGGSWALPGKLLTLAMASVRAASAAHARWSARRLRDRAYPEQVMGL